MLPLGPFGSTPGRWVPSSAYRSCAGDSQRDYVEDASSSLPLRMSSRLQSEVFGNRRQPGWIGWRPSLVNPGASAYSLPPVPSSSRSAMTCSTRSQNTSGSARRPLSPRHRDVPRGTDRIVKPAEQPVDRPGPGETIPDLPDRLRGRPCLPAPPQPATQPRGGRSQRQVNEHLPLRGSAKCPSSLHPSAVPPKDPSRTSIALSQYTQIPQPCSTSPQ